MCNLHLSGLPQSIEGNVTASKPQTLEEAINISQRLMDQIIKRDSVQETNDYKRKLEDKGNIVNNNNYQNNYNNNNRNNDYHRQQNRRQETFKIYTATNGYTGNRPLCERCTLHHIVAQQKHGRPITHRFHKSKYFITQVLSESEEILLDIIKRMPPKRTSTSETPAITLDAIQQLIANGIATALVDKACDPIAFVSCVSLSTSYGYGRLLAVASFDGTLTNDALSWWNSYAQPIGINQANQITWTELKRLLTNKYCPRSEVKKMEDEFYNLVVKGNDLKTYIRRFQELAVLCPNMVPNTEKLMEVFISGLPRSIEGNVTALKPRTLEEATNIAQRKDIMRISAQKQTTRPQESILRDKLALVHFRISTLETTLEDIQVHHHNLLKHTS
ncbi:reverse transcriptase domain-containing protein [Tanacetum coccineum]